MSKALKIGFILFAVFAGGLLALCVWGYRMVTGSLPIVQGEIDLPGPRAEVCIYRDGYHIPHIIAKNERDLFFAQGFVTAQDRLWQMDVWRRTAQGRLSEILGRNALKSDSLMLMLGLKQTAQEILPQLSAESRTIYQAYTDGVNAYMKKNENNLPIEYHLLNYKPAPWQVEDCISILRLFALRYSRDWIIDLVLGTIAEKLGVEHTRRLIPDRHVHPPINRSWKNQSSITLSQRAIQLLKRGDISQSCYTGAGWVISGKRSVTEKPFLAINMNTPLANPTHWYEIHLVGDDFNVYGFSHPGFPLVVAGYNQDIAWGLTDIVANDTELFIEQLDPNNLNRVLFNGSYRSMETTVEEIPQKLESPVRITVQKTHNGPVIAKTSPEDDSTPLALTLRWTGHQATDEGKSLYYLNRAKDWTTFRNALKDFQVPCLNFLYADSEGNIGIQTAGRVTLKPKASGFSPTLKDMKAVAPIPYDALPSIINPQAGFIAMTGSKIEDSNGHSISHKPDLPSLRDRIHRLLTEKEKYSVNDCKQIQSDILSLYGKTLIDEVIPFLSHPAVSDSIPQELKERLEQWDGRMKTGSPEAAFSEVLVDKILRNLFSDEMGEDLFVEFMNLYPLPLSSLTYILTDPDNPWIDDITTKEISEDKQDIIINSLSQSVSFLKQGWSEEVTKWSWGELHSLTFRHPLGQHPFLAKAFNMGPFHLGGSGTTVNGSRCSTTNPFNVTLGTSACMIVDLSNLNNSISVIPTGQSGQPLDEHYRDQLHLYMGNLYHPNLTDTLRIRQSGWNLLRLQPTPTEEVQ